MSSLEKRISSMPEMASCANRVSVTRPWVFTVKGAPSSMRMEAPVGAAVSTTMASLTTAVVLPASSRNRAYTVRLPVPPSGRSTTVTSPPGIAVHVAPGKPGSRET